MEPKRALVRILVMKQNTSIAVLIVTAAFAIAPAVTNPFMGFTASQLPVPQIDPPIQPAGYAFSIWGLIYGWLIVSAVFGVWKRRLDDGWHQARLPLLVSLAIGVPWLAIAGASAIWATVTIALMAIFAILALLRAPLTDRWWLQAPVAIYAGWLTAATFVSVGSTMAGYAILTDAQGWAYIGISSALAVALLVLWQRPSAPEYGFTVVWALVGIIVFNGTDNLPVTGLAAIGIVIVASFALLRKTPITFSNA